MEHPFTNKIQEILQKHFGENFKDVFQRSELLQYINNKTKSATLGSKSRGSFANLYAIYVLVEDYLKNKFDETGLYSKYEGAEYSKLLIRQRSLPFGEKLQNHALNSRMKEEFKKFFPSSRFEPILRDLKTTRYWVNEGLLKIVVKNESAHIAKAIIDIIDAYIAIKQDAFQKFIGDCRALQSIEKEHPNKAKEFILALLSPNVDARLFEIVSFSILKKHYERTLVVWYLVDEDETTTETQTDKLKLYKTGRTNANDGGIDFVMKPLGRFFQVTETLDFRKYFLDIDKVERFPITFVVKSTEEVAELLAKIKINALEAYGVDTVVESYMDCIEELINIPVLSAYLEKIEKREGLQGVLSEIVEQSKLEFNYWEEDSA